jgi:hypothetical protein
MNFISKAMEPTFIVETSVRMTPGGHLYFTSTFLCILDTSQLRTVICSPLGVLMERSYCIDGI